jgi:hypothetical protein
MAAPESATAVPMRYLRGVKTTVLACIALMALPVGCKGSETNATAPATSATPAASTVAPAAIADAGASEAESPDAEAAEQRHHLMNLPPVGPTVTVVLEGKAKDVALDDVAGDRPSPSVALLDVFKRAWPGQDPAHLQFELVGSDGFRSSSKSKCARLLSGDQVKHFRLNVASHDAIVDEGLAVPGCYHVHAVERIEVTR